MKNISDQVTFDEGLKDIYIKKKKKLQDCCKNCRSAIISYRGQHLSQSKSIFIRSHLDYADAFYGQTYPQKIGS